MSLESLTHELATVGVFLGKEKHPRRSRHEENFLGDYLTVRLLAPTLALRVHGMPHRRGRWYAFHINAGLCSRYRDAFALLERIVPGEADLYELQTDSILNIGIAAPVKLEDGTDLPGGGIQAELISARRDPVLRGRFS